MSHLVAKQAYKNLEERINRFPQGAAPTKTLYKILGLLFIEKEASLVAQLPIKPFKPKTAAKIWGKSLSESIKILDSLASRCILFDMETESNKKYVLPPPMVGFFEFTMIRVRDDVDQQLLSELFHQYVCVEEDFIKDLFFDCETRFGRALVNESVLTNEQTAFVLDYEKASSIIEDAVDMGVSMCYCRHVKQHLGTNCDAPLELCLTFNNSAKTLIKHGFSRKIDKSECKDILQTGYEKNLVQFGENARKDVSFVCNCCGCCCEALNAARNFGNLHPIETSNFLPTLNESSCISCKICELRCPIDAIEMSTDEKSLPIIDENVCLGCGVCVRSCPNKSLTLKKRDVRVITPANSVHRTVLIAIEKGKLPDLLFDNKALFSHRALAAIISAILKLSPIQKMMASKQLKSVYLDKLLGRMQL